MFFGADEEGFFALCAKFSEEIAGIVELACGDFGVDDVDALVGLVDEGLHLGVPALGAMTKVNAGFDELFYFDAWHRQY